MATGLPAPPYLPQDPNSPQQQQQQQQQQQTAYTHPEREAQEANYVVPLWRLGDQPDIVDCPFCHQRAKTRVSRSNSGMTHLAGGFIALFCVGLACLPCMLGWAQEVDHYCGSCLKLLTHRPYNGEVQLVDPARVAQGQGQRTSKAPGPQRKLIITKKS